MKNFGNNFEDNFRDNVRYNVRDNSCFDKFTCITFFVSFDPKISTKTFLGFSETPETFLDKFFGQFKKKLWTIYLDNILDNFQDNISENWTIFWTFLNDFGDSFKDKFWGNFMENFVNNFGDNFRDNARDNVKDNVRDNSCLNKFTCITFFVSFDPKISTKTFLGLSETPG